MKKLLFTGVCTALVTPFLDGRVNYPMMEQLLRRQNIRILHQARVFDRYVELTRTARRLCYRFISREESEERESGG